MTAAAPPLAPDLTEGLRRLKLAAIRRLAPELLLTAKTQRWAPEELLRTLVEAEISARDASNARTRLKNAAFPVTKTLDEFDGVAFLVLFPVEGGWAAALAAAVAAVVLLVFLDRDDRLDPALAQVGAVGGGGVGLVAHSGAGPGAGGGPCPGGRCGWPP